MGRPPIGKLTGVRLDERTLSRIDAIAGPGRRARFLRDAIECHLGIIETAPSVDRARALEALAQGAAAVYRERRPGSLVPHEDWLAIMEGALSVLEGCGYQLSSASADLAE